MKNIITMLIILILPVSLYLFFSKNSGNIGSARSTNMPSILIFTSTMCMDCQKLKGVIKEVEPIYNNKINFVSINALDKNKKVQDSIKKHNIALVPTMIFIDENGTQINKIEGFITKENLINEIEDAING